MINRLTTTLSAPDSLPLHPPFPNEISCLHSQYRHFEKTKESIYGTRTIFELVDKGPARNGARPDETGYEKELKILLHIIVDY